MTLDPARRWERRRMEMLKVEIARREAEIEHLKAEIERLTTVNEELLEALEGTHERTMHNLRG